MKKIQVSILGCGRIGRRHAQEYRNHQNVQIKGFYDIQQSLAENLASEYHAKAYHSIDSIMKDSDIDAVSICTPNALHFEILYDAIKSGKNILVEKPIVTSLEHCNSIMNIMKKSSARVMVGHIHRFFPCNLALKSVLDSEEIGKPIIINTFDYIPGKMPGEKMPGWMKFGKISGGGVFMTDLVHTVDRISWLLSSPIKKVFTPFLSNFITNKGVEDAGIAIIWLKNGAMATCVHGCPSPGELDMSIQVMGTKGEVSLEFAGNLEVHKKTISSLEYEHKGNYLLHSSAAFSAEIDEFVKSILEDRQPKVNYKDGIIAVRVILALYESFKTKKPVLIKN